MAAEGDRIDFMFLCPLTQLLDPLLANTSQLYSHCMGLGPEVGPATGHASMPF